MRVTVGSSAFGQRVRAQDVPSVRPLARAVVT